MLPATLAIIQSGSATVETAGPTGVEVEALTAVPISLLTLYDMCKAADRGTTITNVKLLEKHGGSRGALLMGRDRPVGSIQ